jgi:hypothetical protein
MNVYDRHFIKIFMFKRTYGNKGSMLEKGFEHVDHYGV